MMATSMPYTNRVLCMTLARSAFQTASCSSPGKLTREEYEIMKTHTIIGGDALKAAESKLPGRSFLTLGKEIAYHHHEKFDGSGYPFGLSGVSIPLCARIVAFADAYDALTSKRVYKDMVGPEESKRRLLTDRGKHFDPEVVDAFLNCEPRLPQDSG